VCTTATFIPVKTLIFFLHRFRQKQLHLAPSERANSKLLRSSAATTVDRYFTTLRTRRGKLDVRALDQSEAPHLIDRIDSKSARITRGTGHVHSDSFRSHLLHTRTYSDELISGPRTVGFQHVVPVAVAPAIR
jgi:hypothetical protein